MTKAFDYNGISHTIDAPNTITFESEFDKEVYTYIYNHITGNKVTPLIDFDHFKKDHISDKILEIAKRTPIKIPPKYKKPESQKSFLMKSFFKKHPFLFNFWKNLHVDAKTNIQSVELLLKSETDKESFIKIKKTIDDFNRDRWTRAQNQTEKQGGVSLLGSISERLIEQALQEYIDNSTFFKTNNNLIQSYGDFVLMCLPNNLWISVKSNYARERLLASGYTTDILGVGFFVDPQEFITHGKLRNYQKVGFLAMYLPDIAVTDEQDAKNTSTYQEVINHFTTTVGQEPLNINNKPFFRRLSELHSDLSELMSEKDIRKRVTIGF